MNANDSINQEESAGIDSSIENSAHFNKLNLKKAAEFMKDLDFDDSEIEIIYDRAKDLLQNKQIEQITQKIIQGETRDDDLVELLKTLSDTMDKNDYITMIKSIARDEKFLDFMQDMLLEKII